MKKKIVRITTVSLSLNKLLEGQLNFMNNYYKVIAISSDKEGLEKVGVREGVTTHTVEMTRKITPIKDLISLFKLYQFFKKEKPYMVHTHTPKAGVVGMLASKMAKVPVRLHTVAGLPLTELKGVKRKILNFVEKLTYSCATKIYPNSFGLMTIIESEKFTTKNKLKVIGSGSSNGIDTNYFNPNLFDESIKVELKKELGIANKDFVFIFVGRIVGDKGINELVEAFNKLNRKHNCKLLLVGPTEEDLDPIKRETNLIIEKNKDIITTGYKEDVRPYFAISNALAFPSYREGFPNVVMQAGAMGLPSIVSNINGCNEIIKNNVNGHIINVKNAEMLYYKMKEYLLNENNYLVLKGSTRRVILEKYERSVFLEELLKEYRTFE